MRSKQQLILEQVDKKLQLFKDKGPYKVPEKGWIYSIRTALRMSLRQLGERLQISPQSVKAIEVREEAGAVTLNTLKEVGAALEMKLVYGFIPQQESLEAMIEKKAVELATEIVMRTSQTMKLEAQENDPERIKRAIQERARELKDTMPRYLWD